MSKLIIANWKCNPSSLKEAARLFEAVEQNVRNVKDVEVIICAPFVYLLKCSALPKISSLKANKFKMEQVPRKREQNSKFKLGAQNCFWEQKGPFTGEVSPAMLKSVNCEYVIIGHSERREHFNETDEVINRKLKAALDVRLKPILCIGEREEEKEQMKDVVEKQLNECLKDIKSGQIANIIFVYEPVWAISTSGGQYCSPDYVFGASLVMRKFLINHYGKYAGDKAKIIYGGSVDSKDAAVYIKEAKTDGVLVGAASLNANEFVKIISSVAAITQNSNVKSQNHM